ncbi:MAG: 2-polyprenyl-6-methoxyphenol hydroxylase-like FAD-dependent oxidoreductase [Sphingobacteriales bacterium]|jgi:2-polyprenyl-6-methoxyphenol hydroxylase-like FAD-dependent oxidoreductase
METNNWSICEACQGRGKKSQRLRKKARLRYQLELEHFEKGDKKELPPIRPKGHQEPCAHCSAAGVVAAPLPPKPDHENYPHVAIIGGGIGGAALAVACLHRGIPFTLYERDTSFDARSQGYGLTLQQATKAIDGLGVFNLEDGIISTRHLVHTPEGELIGEWGMRKWLKTKEKSTPKRTNIHIARQALRSAILDQLQRHSSVQWGHQFLNFKEKPEGGLELSFMAEGKKKQVNADLLVGADGIRSAVRPLLIPEETTPLRYLGCIVILGICPLSAIEDHELLDSATVFQTANGHERIYMMPFSKDAVMWQLSFPMTEKEAKELSAKGPEALKEEGCKRTQWHKPIPQIMGATEIQAISGYPVYDRALLTPDLLTSGGPVTILGDAAHPMSPFKGQGANQALLDALSLAREITQGCRPKSNWREKGIRASVLEAFELEMLDRSAAKVEDSAEAAQFLHSDIVLHQGDEPRGRVLKRNEG